MTTMREAAEPILYEELPPLPYAGFGLRLVAAVLDLIVLTSVFLLFCCAAGVYLLSQTDWGNADDITNSEGYTAIGIAAIFLFFLPVYFMALWWWHGQTIGQMAVRIAVTDRDGYHISGWRAFLRTLTWPLSIIPLGFGIAMIFFDSEKRALHDVLSGTVVLELP